MTNTVKFVRVTKVHDSEKDYLTVGKLYPVQRIDEDGDYHVIDDENDENYVDSRDGELVEGKEVVKCTQLLTGDRDKFVVEDLYEVLSTDPDGDVRVKDKNGDKSLLVTRQFERVYVPASPAKEPAKKYVRVTRLLPIDKRLNNITVGKVYKVLEKVDRHVRVTDDKGERTVLASYQIEYVEGPEPGTKTKVKVINPSDMDSLVLKKGDVLDVIREIDHSYVVHVNGTGSWHINKERVVEVNY